MHVADFCKKNHKHLKVYDQKVDKNIHHTK
jgi:hypothetical protein